MLDRAWGSAGRTLGVFGFLSGSHISHSTTTAPHVHPASCQGFMCELESIYPDWAAPKSDSPTSP